MDDWFHLLLSVFIYGKLAMLMYFGLSYLSFMQATKGGGRTVRRSNARQQQQQQKQQQKQD